MAVIKIGRAFASIAISLCLLLAVSCNAPDKASENNRSSIVAAHIDAIRKTSSYTQEENIWADLVNGFHRSPKMASDEDIHALSVLMGDHDDMVRTHAAMALGELGMRARPAAPALISAFKEVECLRVDHSSAQSIA